MTHTAGIAQVRVGADGAGWLEAGFVAAALLVATAPLDAFAAAMPAVVKARAGLWGVIYLGFFVLGALHAVPLLRALGRLGPLTALCGFALVSVLWSGQPQHTAVAAVQMSAVVVFGATIGVRLSAERLLFLVLLVLLAVGIGSLAMAFGHPAGRDLNGDVNGLFNHKNTMGQRATALTLVSAAMIAAGVRRGWALAGVLLGVVLLGLSGSRTSWVSSLAGTGVIGVFTLVRLAPGPRMAAVMFGGAIACGVAAIVVSGWFDAVAVAFGAMNRDTGMTGRAMLWDLALRYIGESPFVGYGFDGFWDKDNPVSPSAYVGRVMRQELPHFHNGYIEMAVQLGVAGAVLLVVAGIFLGARMLRFLECGRLLPGLAGIGLVAAAMVSNMAEVSLIERHGFTLLVLTALAAQATRDDEGT